jgi:hypothetical protein
MIIIQRFEDRLEIEENQYQHVTELFEDAIGENMIDEPSRNKLSYRLKELEWRYKELWREHDNNKER